VRRPVDQKFKVSSPYGPRTHPVTKQPESFHTGVDFACPVGTPAVAVCDGVVELLRTKADGNGAGNRLWLYTKTKRIGYFHLDDDGFVAKKGQAVKEGELVAFTGNTGRSTGPHLHLELQDLKTMKHEEPVFG
jgi:murein DD-endopeptidase